MPADSFTNTVEKYHIAECKPWNTARTLGLGNRNDSTQCGRLDRNLANVMACKTSIYRVEPLQW